MDDKKQQFIADFRQWLRDYKLMMERGAAVSGEWSALYQSVLVDADMPDGVLTDDTSQLSSFTTALANMETMLTAFDAGIDTNFERVA